MDGSPEYTPPEGQQKQPSKKALGAVSTVALAALIAHSGGGHGERTPVLPSSPTPIVEEGSMPSQAKSDLYKVVDSTTTSEQNPNSMEAKALKDEILPLCQSTVTDLLNLNYPTMSNLGEVFAPTDENVAGFLKSSEHGPYGEGGYYESKVLPDGRRQITCTKMMSVESEIGVTIEVDPDGNVVSREVSFLSPRYTEQNEDGSITHKVIPDGELGKAVQSWAKIPANPFDNGKVTTDSELSVKHYIAKGVVGDREYAVDFETGSTGDAHDASNLTVSESTITTAGTSSAS